MIHIRVVYRNTFGACGLHTWVHESEINKVLASRDIPTNAEVWLDRGDRFDRYSGYENYNFELTA